MRIPVTGVLLDLLLRDFIREQTEPVGSVDRGWAGIQVSLWNALSRPKNRVKRFIPAPL